LFNIKITDLARDQLEKLKQDKSLVKKYNKVIKTIKLLAENPKHPGLHTHRFISLKGPNGEKVFEAYVDQATPNAYRVFWCYGPGKEDITIIAIVPHP
jgi:hypothetical protein